MVETPNHGYDVPEQGEQNWHEPLNANFEAFEVDIELRDEGAPDANGYNPTDGAKYLDTTTGEVYLADGNAWSQEFSFGGGGGGGGISSLTGGDGIDPSSIDDGDTVSVAWADANDLDSEGNITGGGGSTSLTGGKGIDPSDIGDGDTLSVVSADFAGTYLSTDGSENLSVNVGSGLENDGSGNLRASLGNALAFDGSNRIAVPSSSITTSELATPFADLVTLFGDPVVIGGDLQSAGPLRVNTNGGDRALELGVPSSDGNGNTAGGNVLAGSPNNSIDDAVGAVVAGGGSDSAANSVSNNYATVGGGQSNTAEGISSTVGGGDGNTAGFTGATVSGGQDNTASTTNATVGGGTGNTAGGLGSAPGATVGGGENNSAKGPHATVGGGEDNAAEGVSATVAGGLNNTAGKFTATVGGGQSNTASEDFGTVPGGGFGAAEETSSFVWNDTTGYHSIPDASSDGLSSNTAVDGEPVTGANTFSVSATNGVRFITGDASNPNVTYIPGDSAGWTTTSSRAVKTNIDPIEPREALAGVEELEVATWEYERENGDGAGTTHIGPMAEEFHEAFDVGSSDEHINSINADGVALAAIQGLSTELDERDERIDELEAEGDRKDDRIAELETTVETQREELAEREDRIADLESRLAAVEDQLGDGDGQ